MISRGLIEPLKRFVSLFIGQRKGGENKKEGT